MTVHVAYDDLDVNGEDFEIAMITLRAFAVQQGSRMERAAIVRKRPPAAIALSSLNAARIVASVLDAEMVRVLSDLRKNR